MMRKEGKPCHSILSAIPSLLRKQPIMMKQVRLSTVLKCRTAKTRCFNKFSTCFQIYTAEEFIAAITQHIPEKAFQNTNPLTHPIKTKAFAPLNIERQS